jgi:iron complex outermembrane receptor protein
MLNEHDWPEPHIVRQSEVISMRPISIAINSACISAIAATLLITPAGFALAAESNVLEEVIVTARKREESLQDIPISVQAFSGNVIAEQGIVALQDLAPYTPSFSYAQAAGASDLYFMRGIGTFGSGIHFEPGVGQVFNGFFSTRGRLGRSALVDVAQVEVLKGPQGAIIGKNTSLGAINITTNKPTEDFEALFAAQYNFEASEGYEVDAVVSGPFSDRVRGRVAINYRDVDGWVKNKPTGNTLPQSKDLTARFMLDVDVTESFTAEFMYQRTDIDREGKARVPAGCQEYAPPAGPPHSIARATANGFNCFLTDSNSTQDLRRDSAGGEVFNSKEPFTLENDFLGMTLVWEMEAFEITSLTGYFSYDITDMFSGDQTDRERVSIQNTESYDQFYQELRINSTTAGDIDYTAGLMYFDGDMDGTQSFHAVAGAIGGPSAPALARHEFYQSQTESLAAFAEIDWHLGDKFTLTLGGRYTDEDRDGAKAQIPGQIYSDPSEADVSLCFKAGPLSPCTLGDDGITPGAPITGSISDQDFSYNVSLSYAANDSSNFYATYATGFKSGGFDLRGAGNPDKFIFGPEESFNFEVGGKHTLAGGSVRFNWAIFHTEVDDLQTAANDPVIIQQIVAQGDVTSEGVEVDFLWAATDRLRLSFIATWLDAEYDRFIGSCYLSQVETGTGCLNVEIVAGQRTGVQDLEGEQLVFAPDFQSVLGGDYTLPVGDNKDLIFSAKWIHVGKHFTTIERDPLGIQDATDRFDVTIALYAERWSLALVGRNLTDEVIQTFGNASTLSGTAVLATNIEETRAVALRATYNWW